MVNCIDNFFVKDGVINGKKIFSLITSFNKRTKDFYSGIVYKYDGVKTRRCAQIDQITL